MGRQRNVRVDTELITGLKHLVKEKRDELGLKKYRSVSQITEEAIRRFLLQERQSVEVPA